MDNDVLRLLRMIYHPRPGQDFVTSLGKQEESNYFSPPFSTVVKQEFGYGGGSIDERGLGR
jgi:hypothetical protein